MKMELYHINLVYHNAHLKDLTKISLIANIAANSENPVVQLLAWAIIQHLCDE